MSRSPTNGALDKKLSFARTQYHSIEYLCKSFRNIAHILKVRFAQPDTIDARRKEKLISEDIVDPVKLLPQEEKLLESVPSIENIVFSAGEIERREKDS